MIRLHVADLREGPIDAAGEDFRYLARVLRVRPGDELVVFDGRGHEAPARVERIDDAARVVTLAVAPANAVAGPPSLTLLVALLKGEKMDLVVQKATELGVTRLVPVATARSVVRLPGERAGGRQLRWAKIAREAARQCGRAGVPEIAAPTPLAGALAAAPADHARIALYEGERECTLRQVLPTEALRGVVLLVGPEGGFEPAEIEQARAAGFAIAGLGRRVLRAETAVLAALAITAFALGDLG